MASQPSPTLAEFVADYVARRDDDVPKTTLKKLKNSQRKLAEFFGPDKLLTDITEGDAEDFERYLRSADSRKNAYAGTGANEGLAEDTVRKRISNCKQIFRAAVKRRIIEQNPFTEIASSVVGNRDRDFFVTTEMAYRILDALPDAEWRLLFALSRFGGFRCPSEHLALKIEYVNWDADRMTVRAPKMVRHRKKEYRTIPIFAELRPYLEESWHQANPGQEYFITRYRKSTQNLRSQLARYIRPGALA